MFVKFLDLNRNYRVIKEEIKNNIANVLEKNNYILGDEVEDFEKNFSRYLGVKYFTGVANGTDALEISLNSLDLDPEDEVIVQSNTFISTCLGVISNNYKLVLCDYYNDTYQINLEDLESKITNKTKVIIVVHMYGLVPDMEKIEKICKKNNIILIEDVAQAHGALWKEKKLGSFGKISCFSFYPGKNLGAYGDAGGIATNDNELDIKIKKIRNNGSILKYQHEIIGRNSRLDTLQASILNVKLKYLDINNEKRRNNASLYRQLLKDVEEIILPKELENTTPVYHLFVIRTKYRDELKKFLQTQQIETMIHYPYDCSELECFKKLNLKKNTESVSKEILSLPMYPELTEKEIVYVCDNIKKMFELRKKNVIKLKSINTPGKNGTLNCLNSLQFNTKRIFYINNFGNNLCDRGNHANLNFNEYLFILKGELDIELVSKNNEKTYYKLFEEEGIFINKNTWLKFNTNKKETIVFVMADEEIEKSKSIYNFSNFLEDYFIKKL